MEDNINSSMMTFSSNVSMATTSYDKKQGGSGLPDSWDDATWILTSSFIIFTMQSGFGLLEAGMVHPKNEANIMIKNLVDVVFGGLSYWIFGYGFSYGTEKGTNPFCGIGHWFVTSSDDEKMGLIYSGFIFQLSFTTTATTIVSGAMAERTKLNAYIIYSFFNTLVYCFPAHWVWAENGILWKYGVIDIAGSGVVHMLGGVSALVAAYLLGPRTGRYDGTQHKMGHPSNAVIGLFMLWWGWLAFNAGSTYGISGSKWKLASKSACVTMLASTGGGITGILLSYLMHKKFLIEDIINSILGALVSVTASCAVVQPEESILIGVSGGILSMLTPYLMDKIKINVPVGAFSVHGVSGFWGMLCVGIFADIDRGEDMTRGQRGLLHGGGASLLMWQAIGSLCIIVWTVITTLAILLPLHFTMGLRLSLEHEKLGSDFCEHGITQHVTQGAMASQERATVKEEGTENGKNARIEAGKEKNNENFEGEIDKGSNLGIINEAFSMEGPV